MNATTDSDRVALEDLQAQSVLSIRATIPVAELGNVQGERFEALAAFMKSRGITPAGPPVVRYHTFGETETDVETAVPVDNTMAGEGSIVPGELPAGPAITTWHRGAHDRLGDAYGRLHAWLAESGRDASGPAWEIYPWIDLGKADPSKWDAPTDSRIQLIQPIS